MVLDGETRMNNIPLETALALLKKYSQLNMENETLPLLNVLGRVSAEDIVARHDQPPFNRSPLDGYAIHGSDTELATKERPVILSVIDQVCAGQVSSRGIKKGQCIRIMTGGLIPEGSCGVVAQEFTDGGQDKVTIFKGIEPYQNYCHAGEDYTIGEVLVKEGQLLTAYQLGLLASNGITKVSVKRQLSVGLMSTGDELLEPGENLQPGKIYNSNLYTLAGRLMALGCKPIIIGRVPDDAEKAMALINKTMPQVDMIITSGGVSVGKKDIMHPVYKGLHVKQLFWKLKLKPGTPALAGILRTSSFCLYQEIPLLRQ